MATINRSLRKKLGGRGGKNRIAEETNTVIIKKDECHNHETPCCSLAQRITLEIFPPEDSDNSIDFHSEYFNVKDMPVEQSLMGSIVRNYLLQERRNEIDASNGNATTGSSTAAKKRRKRKKKKSNSNILESNSKDEAVLTIGEVDESATQSTLSKSTSSMSIKSKGSSETTSTVHPKPNVMPKRKGSNIDRFLDQNLERYENRKNLNIENRDLASFVSFLSQRFQNSQGSGKVLLNGVANGGKKKSKGTKLISSIEILPTISQKDISAACESIDCKECRLAVETHLRSTCGNITDTMHCSDQDGWFDSSYKVNERVSSSISLTKSSVEIADTTKNGSRLRRRPSASSSSTLSVPVLGKSNFCDLDVDKAFDYHAMEEGVVATDSNIEKTSIEEAGFCIALHSIEGGSDDFYQGLQMKVGVDDENLLRYPLSLNDIIDMIRYIVLPCGLSKQTIDGLQSEEEEGQYQLTQEQLQSLKEKVESEEASFFEKYKQIGDTLTTLQAEIGELELHEAMASSFDVSSTSALLDCDRKCNLLFDDLLDVLLTVVTEYHLIIQRGDVAQDWAKNIIGDLWFAYEASITEILTLAHGHEDTLLQLASRTGTLPQMYLNASHRDSFRSMVSNKLREMSRLKQTFDDALFVSDNFSNDLVFLADEEPSFMRKLYTYESFFTIVNSCDNEIAAVSQEIDNCCFEILKSYNHGSHIIQCANVRSIYENQNNHCTKMKNHFFKMNEYLINEHKSISGSIPDEKLLKEWTRLREEYYIMTSTIQPKESDNSSIDFEEVVSLRLKLEQLVNQIVMQWLWLKSMQHGFRVTGPIHLPAKVEKSMFSSIENGTDSNSIKCDGGGKRRVSSFLAGLTYRWLCDRCLEWHAELTQNELIGSMNDMLGGDSSATADGSSSRPTKSGKKAKKKREKKASNITSKQGVEAAKSDNGTSKEEAKSNNQACTDADVINEGSINLKGTTSEEQHELNALPSLPENGCRENTPQSQECETEKFSTDEFNNYGQNASVPLHIKYPVNSIVRVTLLPSNEVVEGLVYCSDEACNILVLNTKVGVRLINAACILEQVLVKNMLSDAVPDGEDGGEEDSPKEYEFVPLPDSPCEKALQEKEKRSMRLAKESFKEINTDASPLGQAMFDRLVKACNDVVWSGESIVVLNQVTVGPPYNAEDCKILQKEKSNPSVQGSLERVKKIVAATSTIEIK